MIPEIIEVEVTEHYIEYGTPGDETDCPIAIAIWEQLFPDARKDDDDYFAHIVEVMPTLVTVDKAIFEVPEDIVVWIEQYDTEASVDPITFTLHHIATLI